MEIRETPRNSRNAAKLQNRVECVESVECAESCRSVLNRVEPSTLPPPRNLMGPSSVLVTGCNGVQILISAPRG